MPSLAKVQADFINHLLDPDGAFLIPNSLSRTVGNIAVRQRFAIYRNNVISSLIEAMSDNFPAVKQLVGEEFFNAAARLWVMENPPVKPMLFLYGEGFANFLQNFEPAQDLPYLADVARLEQVHREAYYAPDASSCSIDVLTTIEERDLADICFCLHPSVRVITSVYPVHSLWEYNAHEQHHKDMDLRGFAAESVFLVRPSLNVFHAVLDEGAIAFIAMLLQGKTLGEASDYAGSYPDFELSTTLTHLFKSGGVSCITLITK